MGASHSSCSDFGSERGAIHATSTAGPVYGMTKPVPHALTWPASGGDA